MKEFLAKPSFLGTHGTLGADLSYTLAVLFTIIFLIGWRQGKKRQGNIHHSLVLSGMVAMLVYFSTYYWVRRLGVLAAEGREGFGGPDWVYDYIFTPTLTVHIFLVTFGILIAVYMIILGFRAAHKEGGRRFLKDEELKAENKNILIALTSILVLFGILALVRCHTKACFVVYGVGFLLIAAVFLLEKIVEKFLPNGATRHRILGKFTMVMYVIILITSTMTYLLLYVLYHPDIPAA